MSWTGWDGIEGSLRCPSGTKKTVIWYDKLKARQRGRNNNCTIIANEIRPGVGYNYIHTKKVKMTALW